MLASRFRKLKLTLGIALHALIERGWTASRAVTGICERVAARSARLETLMQRFDKGTLRARAASIRKAGAGKATGLPVVATLWPEHVPNWLYLMGFNSPSTEVRHRWTRWWPPDSRHAADFGRGMRALVEEDAAMRGLLCISREARRLGRWFLRMADAGPMPEILKEPRRKPKAQRTAQRKMRTMEDRRPRPRRAPGHKAEPKPPRPKGPYEVPPDNLLRAEREERGLPVPPVIYLHDPATLPWTPTHIQLEGRRRTGW